MEFVSNPPNAGDLDAKYEALLKIQPEQQEPKNYSQPQLISSHSDVVVQLSYRLCSSLTQVISVLGFS